MDLTPCGEILGNDFHCNLAEVHLNQIDPENFEEQKKAFKAAALSVACLLNHEFEVCLLYTSPSPRDRG